MTYEQALDELRNIFNRLNSQSPNSKDREAASILAAKERVRGRFVPIFSHQHLDDLTDEEARSFLSFRNNEHWESLDRLGGKITKDMSALRSALKILTDESMPIGHRLDRLRPEDGDAMVPGLGKAVLTGILQVLFPDKYGVWNGKSQEALKRLGLWPDLSPRASFSQTYLAVNEVIKRVAKDLNVDLWTLDLLWSRYLDGLEPDNPGQIEDASSSNIHSLHALAGLKEKFLRAFPDFVSFEEPGHGLKTAEIDYKRDAVAKCKTLLAPYVTEQQRLATDDEARDLALQVLTSTNLGNWRDWKIAQEELFAQPGRWLTFMSKMLACLEVSDTEAWKSKLDDLLGWLESLKCPANLSKVLPTLFLFLWDPDHHVFIKPLITDQFLDELGCERLGSGKRLTVGGYQRFLDVLESIRVGLADWSPRDFLDLQTFYWIVMQEEIGENVWDLACQLIQAYPNNPARLSKEAPAVQIAKRIRSSAVQLARTLAPSPHWRADASVGKGHWAGTPWFAIFDDRVTDSAQKGIYTVVHLLTTEHPGIRIGIGVAVTEFKGQLREKAREVRAQLGESGGEKAARLGFRDSTQGDSSKVHPIGDGKDPEYEEGMIFSKFVPLGEIPSKKEDLNEDLRLMLEIYADWSESRDRQPGTGAPPPRMALPISVDGAYSGLFMPKASFIEMLELLRARKNIILQGPPGTGKTFVAKRLAYALMGAKDTGRIATVQFHQSYSYEDFFQGYRPTDDGFELRDGFFYGFCKRASSDPDNDYILLIDEINRGNMSKIFGELLMLIETDKRGPEWGVTPTYSNNPLETFYVPTNLHFIGTMNTADRSLAMVDYALRRRFAFVDLDPAFEQPQFKTYLVEEGATEEIAARIITRMTNLNQRIAGDFRNLGPGYRIGHSFFCSTDDQTVMDKAWYERVIRFAVAPLLREYWFDDPEQAASAIAECLQ